MFPRPSHSTIVNTVAYRAIALDFILWSKANKEVQLAHLDHFVTLVETSRHVNFNVKQRYNKMGVVRKFLFVLQTELYRPDVMPFLLQALRSIVKAQFHPDETIKPLLSMLAANLHEGSQHLELLIIILDDDTCVNNRTFDIRVSSNCGLANRHRKFEGKSRIGFGNVDFHLSIIS
jgi:hypothetical protein